MQCPITFSEYVIKINSFDEKCHYNLFSLLVYLCKMLLFAEIWSSKKHLVGHRKLEKVEEQRGKVVPTFDRFLVNSNGLEVRKFTE